MVTVNAVCPLVANFLYLCLLLPTFSRTILIHLLTVAVV